MYHWQQLYLRVMNINVSKITHRKCMSLCSMPIALWHIFWNPKLFQTYTRLNLNGSIGGKEASKKPIPVQMHSFDSRFRLYWLGVCPPIDSLRRIQILKRNNSKWYVIPSHSHSNIITAIFTIKSRARHCSKHGFIAF